LPPTVLGIEGGVGRSWSTSRARPPRRLGTGAMTAFDAATKLSGSGRRMRGLCRPARPAAGCVHPADDQARPGRRGDGGHRPCVAPTGSTWPSRATPAWTPPGAAAARSGCGSGWGRRVSRAQLSRCPRAAPSASRPGVGGAPPLPPEPGARAGELSDSPAVRSGRSRCWVVIEVEGPRPCRGRGGTEHLVSGVRGSRGVA
jgi:hypothetical protein